MAVQCTLRLAPDWQMFDAVREFGVLLCRIAEVPRETSERVRVVLQEALEVVVAYGTETSILSLTLTQTAEQIEVSVTSDEQDPRAGDRLRRDVASVSSRPPAEAFLDSLAKSVQQRESLPLLALARMRYEAEFELTAGDGTDALRLSARGHA